MKSDKMMLQLNNVETGARRNGSDDRRGSFPHDAKAIPLVCGDDVSGRREPSVRVDRGIFFVVCFGAL